MSSTKCHQSNWSGFDSCLKKVQPPVSLLWTSVYFCCFGVYGLYRATEMCGLGSLALQLNEDNSRIFFVY